jgi:carotenoid cleavage dioxygenase-like enzyme
MGPARFEWGPDRYRHWFDGSGMIHKFSFAAGKVGYANRYVRGTAFVENERAGRITAQTFATDHARSCSGRVSSTTTRRATRM